MARTRTKISEPPKEFAAILGIVRTLEADACLQDFDDVMSKLDLRFGAEHMLALNERFGLEPGIDFHDGKGIETSLYDEYKKAFQQVQDTFRLAALNICVETLSTEFVRYVDPPNEIESAAFREFTYWKPDTLYETFLHRSRNEPHFLQYCYSGAIGSAVSRYQDGRRFHINLYKLVRYLEKIRAHGLGTLSLEARPTSPFSLIVVKGKIRSVTDDFHDAIEGLEIERLRLCKNPSCGKVFWAKKKVRSGLSEGCSPNCLTLLRTRKWRERTTEEQRKRYKINRIKKDN